jgi:hypothetical protein
MDDTALDLDEQAQKIGKAIRHLQELCSGKEKFTMRVPADESRDSDIIFANGLRAGNDLIAELREARKKRDAAIESRDVEWQRAKEAREQLAEARKDTERLREALRFYADPEHWGEDGSCGNFVGTAEGDIWEEDEGAVAAQALEAAGLQPEGQGE